MIRKISDSVTLVSEDDLSGHPFESQYPVPDGMAYNTYIVKGEKTALLDAPDESVADRWAEELLEALGGRTVDYYVVHHMEPDHSASMKRVLSMFPGARIVASAKALRMMNQFLNADMSAVTDTVKEGDVLDLGGGTQLKFIEAPNVHWPEVIMSYLPAERTLFSVDAWGRFGPGSADYAWMDGARRYYFNIVGKFGAAVLKVLDKASGLDIAGICPLHGCPLEEDIGRYVSVYRGWASYEPEDDGIAVICASFYGNTKRAAEHAAETVRKMGRPVTFVDLMEQDASYAIEAAFRHPAMIVAATTYEGGLNPRMKIFLEELVSKKYGSRRVGIIENGSFGPRSGKIMREILSGAEGISAAENNVTISSAPTEENMAQIESLTKSLLE